MVWQRHSSSQVVTYAPDGTGARWLGALAHVTGLTYSFVLPGGCDQMSATWVVKPELRTDAINPGRRVQIFRGGSVVWDGKLDEPQPSATGWSILAHGSGQFGADFSDIWDSANGGTGKYKSVDNHINTAISRGLRWKNPGLDSSPNAGSYYLYQQEDSGSMTITDFLNLVCTRGGLVWYVSSPGSNVLNLFPLPVTPDRLLISTVPLARTIVADINAIFIRYQSSADKAKGPAVYGLAGTSLPQSVAAHGRMEAYVDLSASGPDVAGATAVAAGQNILRRYQRANFTGEFTVQPGQLTNIGGAPVDLGIDQCSHVANLIVTDYGYGGEVIPGLISFIIGAYSYDDDSRMATVTPFQSVAADMASLTGAMFPTGKRLDPRHHHKPRH